MLKIDLNCDMGESSPDRIVGNDVAIMPFITSCNLACNGHGGGEVITRNAIELARTLGVHVGAHPSYEDRANFGRVSLDLEPQALKDSIYAQLTWFVILLSEFDETLNHVKPHGALYHDVHHKPDIAELFVEVLVGLDFQVPIIGTPGTHFSELCERHGMPFINEFFLDRNYASSTQLVNRGEERAIVEDGDEMATRALAVLSNKRVKTIHGDWFDYEAQTFCVHGDHAHTAQSLHHLRSFFGKNHVEIEAF